ncbi:MAG: hypothetical protein AAF696_37875 [Bacteroidota bacterium]
MFRRFRSYGLILFLLSLLLACESGEPIGPFSTTPEISQLKLSQDSLIEFIDSLYLEFSYEDGNGDIGFSSPNQKSLSVKDSRLEEADLYHIPPLADEELFVHIQGQLQVNLGKLFLLSNDEEEKIVFTVKLRDREGNWSEEVQSDTLLLLRQ